MTPTPSPSGKVEPRHQTWGRMAMRRLRQVLAVERWSASEKDGVTAILAGALASYESEVAERVRAEERERWHKASQQLVLGVKPQCLVCWQYNDEPHSKGCWVAAALRAGEGEGKQ